MATPIIATIPTYNHAEYMGPLLDEILEQEYPGVVVCDDASTEVDALYALMDRYGNDVEFVLGETNIGAGANRNRVLTSNTLERFGEATLHFIDGDALLESKRTPEKIADAIEQPDTGLIGGLVLDEKGMQHSFNYGPPMFGPIRLLRAHLTAGLTIATNKALGNMDRERAFAYRDKLDPLLHEWPNIFDDEPTARDDVGWTLESNLIMSSRIFDRVGGFDPKLRFSEVGDLGAKLTLAGLKRRFEPGIVITARDIPVRGTVQEGLEQARAAVRLALRYSKPSNRRPLELQ